MKQKATLESGQEITFVWDANDVSMEAWTIGKLREEARNREQNINDTDEEEEIPCANI